WGDDADDERSMKEKTKRTNQGDQHKQSSDKPVAETHALAVTAAFHGNGEPLNRKKQRGPSVAAARWYRDDQIVHEAAEGKSSERGCLRSQPRGEGTKQKSMRQIAKRRIPPASPELSEARRD